MSLFKKIKEKIPKIKIETHFSLLYGTYNSSKIDEGDGDLNIGKSARVTIDEIIGHNISISGHVKAKKIHAERDIFILEDAVVEAEKIYAHNRLYIKKGAKVTADIESRYFSCDEAAKYNGTHNTIE